MLGEKMQEHKVNVWLVNTGWSGGPFGVGKRMRLKYTRAMISAALNGDLNNVEYHSHPVFGVSIPSTCKGVPTELLNPRETWADKAAYDKKANQLAGLFNQNFAQYASGVSQEILDAAPSAKSTSH